MKNFKAAKHTCPLKTKLRKNCSPFEYFLSYGKKVEVNLLMCVSILNVYVTLLKCASPSPCSRLKIGVSAFPYAALLVLLRAMHKEMESHYTTVYA